MFTIPDTFLMPNSKAHTQWVVCSNNKWVHRVSLDQTCSLEINVSKASLASPVKLRVTAKTTVGNLKEPTVMGSTTINKVKATKVIRNKAKTIKGSMLKVNMGNNTDSSHHNNNSGSSNMGNRISSNRQLSPTSNRMVNNTNSLSILNLLLKRLIRSSLTSSRDRRISSFPHPHQCQRLSRIRSGPFLIRVLRT